MNPTAATAHTLTLEREVPHPQAKVWRALTKGQLIDEWLMKNDFQPVVGHRFKFRSTPMPSWDGLIEGEVLIVEPISKLAYTWSALALDSVVTWTLTPVANGTHLRMEHSGFPSTESAAYKGANYGWQSFIGKLETVLGRLD